MSTLLVKIEMKKFIAANGCENARIFAVAPDAAAAGVKERNGALPRRKALSSAL